MNLSSGGSSDWGLPLGVLRITLTNTALDAVRS